MMTRQEAQTQQLHSFLVRVRRLRDIVIDSTYSASSRRCPRKQVRYSLLRNGVCAGDKCLA